ncbi:hypothetical protein [Euzebya sp.]|uniref:hypothetical protein n=1 Tax=Euzebya sp. TaxID=1971409 RepID=UPI003511C3C0
MHRRITALAIAALLVLATACSDDAAETTDTAPAASVATESAASITVTGVDYAFEGLPAEIAAGTMVTFTNGSDVEAHELVLVRLPDDEDRPVTELIEGFEPTEEPALVSVAAPGEEGQVFVGDGVVTEPGRYAVVCFLPVGADPEAILSGTGPTESDAPPHAAEGMVAEVVVS